MTAPSNPALGLRIVACMTQLAATTDYDTYQRLRKQYNELKIKQQAMTDKRRKKRYTGVPTNAHAFGRAYYAVEPKLIG